MVVSVLKELHAAVLAPRLAKGVVKGDSFRPQ